MVSVVITAVVLATVLLVLDLLGGRQAARS
ncbi:hypothetical protein FHR81_003203 [Actinoalloteichus hoggarensis]|nr:hypothetical protein [Actinoalloteichus hoggarensis]